MMSTNPNPIRTILDRILSTRLIGLLMALLMSIILMAWPSLLSAQSPSNNETQALSSNGKVTASDGVASDQFGHSVAISGDTMVVGSRLDDDHGTNSGSAYIFSRHQGGTNNWGLVKKVTDSDGAADDLFGYSVAISGDIMVVGAYGDDDNGAASGSAYIFSRHQGGANNWGLVKKVTASDGAGDDYFGYSVAISGDTVVVGAYVDDDRGTNSGSAYIFGRNQGGTNNWGEVKKVTASDRASSDDFGYSVAISGDTVIIGSRYDDDSGSNSGSAYIFSRDHGGTNNWGQVKKIIASDPASHDHFGLSVAINGDTVVVGARGNDDHGSDSGSAYVFSRNQGGTNNWGQVKKVTASDAAGGDWFGESVAISGDTVVVGSAFNDDHGSDSGSAYIFGRHQGGTNNWGELEKLTASDAAGGDRFGVRVATSGRNVVVGSYYDDDNGSNSGSAYIYTIAPQLSLPNDVTQLISDTTGISLTVPIRLTSHSNSIASLGFSLDYDQSCLSFDDQTDSNADGIPDAVTDLQSGFNINVEQALTDTDGELDIAIFSSPVISLTDGTVGYLTFGVDPSCVPQTSADLTFSTDPSVTFGNTVGESVVGMVGTDGPIAINIEPNDMSLSSESVDEEEAIGTPSASSQPPIST